VTTVDGACPSAEDLDTPAARLRYALTLRGTHAHRASLAADLGRSTVRWILDHPADSPRTSTLAALARVLVVDPAWLAFGHPYPAPAVEAAPEGAAPRQVPAVEGVEVPAAASSRAEVPPPSPAAPVAAEVLPPGETPPEQLLPVEVPPAEPPGGVPPSRKRAPRARASTPSPLPAPPADPPAAAALDPDAVRARWRATPGANQHAAARAVGLAQSTLSRFLAGSGARGAPSTVRAVAAYLDALDGARAAAPAPPTQRVLPLNSPR